MPMVSKFLTSLIVLSVALSVVVATAGGAAAQHYGRNNPLTITDGAFAAEAEAAGQSLYFNFDGTAGANTVEVSGRTNYFASSIRVELIDGAGRILGDMLVAASTDGASASKVIRLSQAQRVTLKLTLGLDVGVKVNYNISVRGSGRPGVPHPVASATLDSQPKEAAGTRLASGSGMPTIVLTDNSDDGDEVNANAPIEDKWALIVGVSKFQNSAIDLKYPAKDATDLRDFLVNEANFAPDHVKLLVNEQATKENVMAEIGDKWLPRLVRPNDLVMIFVSSHGSPSQLDLEGVNYLVMHNTDPESLYATGLPLQEFANAIRQRVHCKRIILVIDACHSGAAGAGEHKGIKRVTAVDSAALSQGTGQLVICSSRPNQVSWESTRYPNGVFTYQLIQALRAKNANLAKAFADLKENVVSEVLSDRKELQEPVLRSKWKGDDLVINAPPTKPRKVPDQSKP